MGEPLKFHTNSPAKVHFPCPGCGRVCELEPKFGTDGAARGVRLGHGVAHSVPPCSTYKRLTTLDFMKLAKYEVPILQADVHVSVKEPEAPPLIIADMAHATAEQARRAAEQQIEDLARAHAENLNLQQVRDQLREFDPKPPTRWQRMRQKLTPWTVVRILMLAAFAWLMVRELRR
jgi:hypothetical protein